LSFLGNQTENHTEILILTEQENEGKERRMKNSPRFDIFAAEGKLRMRLGFWGIYRGRCLGFLLWLGV